MVHKQIEKTNFRIHKSVKECFYTDLPKLFSSMDEEIIKVENTFMVIKFIKLEEKEKHKLSI